MSPSSLEHWSKTFRKACRKKAFGVRSILKLQFPPFKLIHCTELPSHLHETLPSDEPLSAECVDHTADMLFIFIWTVQGADNDLAQHLWQEVFGSPHLPHPIHGIRNVLGIQKILYNSFLQDKNAKGVNL